MPILRKEQLAEIRERWVGGEPVALQVSDFTTGQVVGVTSTGRDVIAAQFNGPREVAEANATRFVTAQADVFALQDTCAELERQRDELLAACERFAPIAKRIISETLHTVGEFNEVEEFERAIANARTAAQPQEGESK